MKVNTENQVTHNTQTDTQSQATQTHLIQTDVAETQTNIAGIENLLAWSEHIPCEETEVLPYLEALEQRELFAPGDLVCCKCGKGGDEEELCKCNATGLCTLKAQCTLLGLEDLLKTVETQWNSRRLRIHRSCRTSLWNQSKSYQKQRKS